MSPNKIEDEECCHHRHWCSVCIMPYRLQMDYL